MSKKLIAVLIIGISLIGAFAYINFVYLKDSRPVVNLGRKILPGSASVASLSLLPNYLTVTSSQSATLNIVLSGKLPLTGNKLIQLELAYDPTTLFNVNIYPGDYLINPQITLSNIDYRTGRISYALKGDTNRSDTKSNTVAQVNFMVSSYGLLKQTEIQFLPKTSMLIDDKAVMISSASGTVISIKPTFFQYVSPANSPSQLTPIQP